MSPSQLSSVLRIVADLKGKDAVADRPYLVDLINEIRSMLHQDELTRRKFFTVSDACTLGRTFRNPCRNQCAGTLFTGLVFAPQVVALTEIRTDSCDVRLTEKQVDPCDGDPCLSAEIMPDRWLEFDVPLEGGNRVIFRNDDDKDNGALVGVTYYDQNGTEQREDIEVTTLGAMTRYSVTEFTHIAFPERCGWIKVETEDGSPLGRYHPSILVPRHKWVRLNRNMTGCKFTFRGIIDPMPLRFDTDLCEWGDKPTWKLAVRAQEFLDQVSLTPDQERGMNRIMAQLRAFSESQSLVDRNVSGRLTPSISRSSLSTGRLFGRHHRHGSRAH